MRILNSGPLFYEENDGDDDDDDNDDDDDYPDYGEDMGMQPDCVPPGEC